jgi:hypothetical protein
MWGNKFFLPLLCLWSSWLAPVAANNHPLDGPHDYTSDEKAQMLTDFITRHVENLPFAEDYNRILATTTAATTATTNKPAHECGQILKVYDSETIRNVLSEALENGDKDLSPSTVAMIGNFLLPMFQYGIQIRKVCGKVSDYPQVASALCANDDGGSAATDHEEQESGCGSMQSGILMLPLILTTSVVPGTLPEEGTSQIKPGTLAGMFVFHGSMSNSHHVPSNINFKESDSRGVLATTAMLITSLIGTAVVMPDYLGGW